MSDAIFERTKQEEEQEETTLYESTNIQSFSFNNEPPRSCPLFRITTKALHLLRYKQHVGDSQDTNASSTIATHHHGGGSSDGSEIEFIVPPIPFDKISMHAINNNSALLDDDDDGEEHGDADNGNGSELLLPYIYCHISNFVKLAIAPPTDSASSDNDDDDDDNDNDDGDSFEELAITFATQLSEHEIAQVFDAMNKGAELVPHVEELDEMMQMMMDGENGGVAGDDEWIFNRDEVRKNVHLHERDDDATSELDSELKHKVQRKE